MGYSLQSNRKTEEGGDHPDRDAQFRHINERGSTRRWPRGSRSISVDTQEEGTDRELRQSRPPVAARRSSRCTVNGHDFPTPDVPRAYPVRRSTTWRRNSGFVNVGTDHDTGAFAVASIRGWWRAEGRRLYPKARTTADHRRWRRQQRLPPAAVEAGACRGWPTSTGLDDHGVSLPAGNQQVEQGRASAVLVHLVELARRAAARLRDDRAADRRNDDRQRSEGHAAGWIAADMRPAERSQTRSMQRWT